MADLLMSSGAEIRAADALLRGCGGRTVLLRMPAPGIPGDSSERLGLAVPEFQDVELGPVVVLSARLKTEREVLVSATAVREVVGSLGYAAASALFEVASGLVLDGVLLEVISMTTDESRGVPYLYRVKVRTPAAIVT